MGTIRVCDICGKPLNPLSYLEVKIRLLSFVASEQEICPACWTRMKQLIREEREQNNGRENVQRETNAESMEEIS